MRQVIGRKSLDLSDDAFAVLRADYARMTLDIGTGDGAHVLRSARARPDWLCVGFDPVADAMADTARRARAKPARGGVPNALFLVAAIEAVPPALQGCADEITVHFPWGSLLRGVSLPEPAVLAALAGLGRQGAAFLVLINLHPFADEALAERLDLPPLQTDSPGLETLAQAYRAAGLAPESIDLLREAPESRTSWGRRLVAGSGRQTLKIAGNVTPLADVPPIR